MRGSRFQFGEVEGVLLGRDFVRRLKATALEGHADRSQRHARYEEAAATLQAALRLVSGSKRKIAVVPVLERLAENARLRGDYRGAAQYYRRAVHTIEQVRGRANLSWASACVRLAGLLTELGSYSEANELLSESIKVLERIGRAPLAEVITSLRARTLLLWRQGRLDEAEVAARAAMTMLESASKAKPNPMLLGILQDLELIYTEQGRYRDAESVIEQALALAGQLAVEPARLARLQTNLGSQYSEQGRLEEAEHMLKVALSSHQKAERPIQVDVGHTSHNLGVVYSRQGRYIDAERHLKDALEIFQRTLGPESPTVAISWYSLGTLHRDQGKGPQALDELSRALTIQVSVLPADHPDLSRTRIALASLNSPAASENP
jgi:tetratricopeptide (TPR) repeat protein